MDMQFSDRAVEKQRLFRTLISDSDKGIQGFVIGSYFGQIHVIEDLIQIEFNAGSLDNIYPKMLEIYGNRLLGPFYINCKKIESDWFSEDVIFEF